MCTDYLEAKSDYLPASLALRKTSNELIHNLYEALGTEFVWLFDIECRYSRCTYVSSDRMSMRRPCPDIFATKEVTRYDKRMEGENTRRWADNQGQIESGKNIVESSH